MTPTDGRPAVDSLWHDVSENIYKGECKANPFGWSSIEICHVGNHVGYIYCGSVKPGNVHYRMEIKSIDDKTEKLWVETDYSKEDIEVMEAAYEHLKALGLKK